MTKPSQRHSTHVQSTKPGEPPLPAESEPPPPLAREKGERRMWIALIVWTVVFVILFLILLWMLVVALFRAL